MSPLNPIKLAIVDATGLAKDALHIYVALIIFLGACWLFRWRVSQWRGLFLVLFIVCLGEIIDMRDTLQIEKQLFLRGNLHDVWNTMLAPVMLFVAARFSPVFAKPAPKIPDEESGDQPEV